MWDHIRGIIHVPRWWILFWAGCFTQSVTVELSVDDSIVVSSNLESDTSIHIQINSRPPKWKTLEDVWWQYRYASNKSNRPSSLDYSKKSPKIIYSSSCVISLSGLANCSCSEAYACFDICTLCSSLTRCITKNYDDVQHKMTNQRIDTVGWMNEAMKQASFHQMEWWINECVMCSFIHHSIY